MLDFSHKDIRRINGDNRGGIEFVIWMRGGGDVRSSFE